MNAGLRDLIVDRDRVCGWCGQVNHFPAIHHRQLRKQGGTDDPSNLIALHHGCHNVAKGSVHQEVAAATQRGFLVPSWDEPSKVPLHTAGGGTVLLHSDGTITTITKETWA